MLLTLFDLLLLSLRLNYSHGFWFANPLFRSVSWIESPHKSFLCVSLCFFHWVPATDGMSFLFLKLALISLTLDSIHLLLVFIRSSFFLMLFLNHPSTDNIMILLSIILKVVFVLLLKANNWICIGVRLRKVLLGQIFSKVSLRIVRYIFETSKHLVFIR
jgi:hypothetical protein